MVQIAEEITWVKSMLTTVGEYAFVPMKMYHDNQNCYIHYQQS